MHLETWLGPSLSMSIWLLFRMTDMQVDENTPIPASSGETQRKRKIEPSSKEPAKTSDVKEKKSASPKILQSSRHDAAEDSDDEPVLVTSKQVKRPKLEGQLYGRYTGGATVRELEFPHCTFADSLLCRFFQLLYSFR